MKLKAIKPIVQPKPARKNKLKQSVQNAQTDVEYTYNMQQDELEVKQQFSRYVDQDVYFN